MSVWRATQRGWASERGSNVAQAAAVAILATALIGAMLLITPSLRGAVGQSYSCLVGVLGGSGAGCAGGAAQQTAAEQAGQAAPEQNTEDDGGFWGGVLDVVQGGLDIVGLVPGLGEIADGANGLISLARGDYVGAALSFGAMIPFAGWAATGAKWVRTGVKYSDEIAAGGRSLDNLPGTSRVLDDIPCVGYSKAPGLAKPLAAPCSDIASTLQQRSQRVREELAQHDPKLRRGGRNVASSRVEVEGQAPEELISVSGQDPLPGTVPTPQNRVFDTIEDRFDRQFDTEVKILEEFARRNGGQRGGTYKLRGRIDLFTENSPCLSCNGVVEQFRRMYPDVELNVYYGRGREAQIWTGPATN